MNNNDLANPETQSNQSFTQAMQELDAISKWFQEEEIDLDEGLKQLKRGKQLVKQCMDRLKEVENEFIEIKKEFNEVE